MFSLFNKNKSDFICPARGIIKSLENVEDEVFSSKALGDGFAVTPSTGEVYSPFDGTIEMIFPTLHAIGLKNKQGIEVLVHIGVDTVSLEGKGFTQVVKEGDKIKAGDLIAKFNLDEIRELVPSTDIMFIFTNGESCKINNVNNEVSEKEENIIEINK